LERNGRERQKIKVRFVGSGQEDKARRENYGRQENAFGYERKASGGRVLGNPFPRIWVAPLILGMKGIVPH
jgi:hypothetical protein